MQGIKICGGQIYCVLSTTTSVWAGHVVPPDGHEQTPRAPLQNLCRTNTVLHVAPLMDHEGHAVSKSVGDEYCVLPPNVSGRAMWCPLMAMSRRQGHLFKVTTQILCLHVAPLMGYEGGTQ